MKRFSHPKAINPHAKHFTDSVANVLNSMEKFESSSLAWPTSKGASRKKQDLRSKQDRSFPDVPLAQSPSNLYPFDKSRPRGWWENSSQVRKKNTFYQILQENQNRELSQMSKVYPYNPQKVSPMPVYHPIQNGIDIRNMSFARRPPDDDKVYVKQYENNASLGVHPIHRVKRLPDQPLIDVDVARNTVSSYKRKTPSKPSNVPKTPSSQQFVLSSSFKKVEPKPNSIRTLTQHKKSTGNQKKKTRRQSKPLRISFKRPDTISLCRSRKSDTASIATAILDEIVVAERQSLLQIRSSLIVKPYQQHLPDNQNDEGERRRSIIRENRSRMEVLNKQEDTPRASYVEQLEMFRELLATNTSIHNYNNEIDIDIIDPADVLNFPYPMLPEDTPNIDPSLEQKTKIQPKQKLGAQQTGQPLEKKVAPKKNECCICQALHRNHTKDAPFIVEMKREQKRQELLAYRYKMLAANPSLRVGVWCKTLNNYDQLVHEKVS